MRTFILFFISIFTAGQPESAISPVRPSAVPQKIAGGFQFTEGITADPNGTLYFSDIPAGLIYRISPDGTLSKYIETNRSNGLQVAPDGSLIVCESAGPRRLLRIDRQKNILTLADGYNGKKFNSPNDCWLDPKGGVYMTDPRYGSRDDMQQDGEHVYYITPDRRVIRVIDDMIRPNGLIGTPDGTLLYVADHAAGKTWLYDIQKDGTLANKRLFCSDGSDGMTLDSRGNVYLTWRRQVKIYAPDGQLLDTIDLPESPTNVCIGGPERQTLYINTPSSVYAIDLITKAVGTN
ncbi:MAG: SMP-30/gluconolactonase/LRE family protein [Anaerohalosphaeraceae bacterium]